MSHEGPGLRLARAFYHQVVRPLLGAPDAVPHSAALPGEGSEVLGFDDARSTDHAWGPRLQVFTGDAHVRRARPRLRERLPETFDAHPVRFFAWQDGTVRHHVDVTTLPAWLNRHLRVPVDDLDTAAWLALPKQHLLPVTAGAVFHDEDGALSRARDRLAWYPRDVWLWLLAAQWPPTAWSTSPPGPGTSRRSTARCSPRAGTADEAGRPIHPVAPRGHR